MAKRHVAVALKERPNSSLLKHLRRNSGGTIVVDTSKKLPRIRNTSKTAKRINGPLLGICLGGSDCVSSKDIFKYFKGENGTLNLVFVEGIEYLGNSGKSAIFGDKDGVAAFFGNDIVVEIYYIEYPD